MWLSDRRQRIALYLARLLSKVKGNPAVGSAGLKEEQIKQAVSPRSSGRGVQAIVREGSKMTGSRSTLSKRCMAIAAGLSLMIAMAGSTQATAGSAGSAQQEEWGLPNYDSRDQIAANVSPTVAQSALLKDLQGVSVDWDERYGTVVSMIRYGRFLTRPSDAAPKIVARAFVQRYAPLFGLTPGEVAGLDVTKAYKTKHNGATHVSFGQLDQGRDVFGSTLGLVIDRRGRVAIAGGAPYPGAVAVSAAALTAQQAIERAAAHVGVKMTRRPIVKSVSGDASRKTVLTNTVGRGDGPSDIKAELVTFPMPAGHPAILAWKTTIEVDASGWYRTLVDARTGALLYRNNLYSHSGPEGNVIRAQNPEAGTQQITSFAGASFNDDGWVDDDTTEGNNVLAYRDLEDEDDDTDVQPVRDDQHFNFNFTEAWNTSGGTDLATDLNAITTQMFYYTNVMHDYLYELGFDEASGNFQDDNFGRGGDDGDPVMAESQDGWDDGVTTHCRNSSNQPIHCRNNANFFTPDDGESPRMQMFMWTNPPWEFRDGAMDGDIIAHEYGHGVSNRLVAGGAFDDGPVQTGALGEGWSDTISIYKWNDSLVGEYVTGDDVDAIRGVAYNNSTLDYGDVCNVRGSGACQVHRDGEIWASTTHDLRTALRARHGNAAGTDHAESFIIDGMKATTQASPNYLNARDGILAAELLNTTGANHCLVWKVFADRGMGFGASSAANQMSTTPSTDGPPACVPTADAGGPYETTEGANVTLDASGTLGPASTYTWDFDNDGEFDDATGQSPAFDRVGQDGSFPVKVKARTVEGFEDEDSSTVTVKNAAPVVSLGSNAPKDEGSLVTVTGKISDAGWLDPLTGTIDWGDGSSVQGVSGTTENVRPDATLQINMSHTYGDNGNFNVKVCGKDDDTTTCNSIVLEIRNVPTKVNYDSSQVKEINEGQTVTVLSHFSDPGWLDTYTSKVNWGTTAFPSENGTLAVTTQGPPEDVGTLKASRQYGDNGGFDITSSVTDDDGGSGQDVFTLKVNNVDPTAVIDTTGTTVINGQPTFISHAGDPIDFKGNSKDPGSDDLYLSWDWDDGPPSPDHLTMYLVDPPIADPFPSPTVEPRNETDAKTHAFGDACLYAIAFGAQDDDGGTATDNASVLITGNDDKTHPTGWWQHQYKGNGAIKVEPAHLQCYLEMIAYISNVFNEERDASTFEKAHDVLWMKQNGGSETEKLDRELITALLNFANGAIEYDDVVGGATFGNTIIAAENVRLDPAATKKQLQDQTKKLHSFNN